MWYTGRAENQLSTCGRNCAKPGNYFHKKWNGFDIIALTGRVKSTAIVTIALIFGIDIFSYAIRMAPIDGRKGWLK